MMINRCTSNAAESLYMYDVELNCSATNNTDIAHYKPNKIKSESLEQNMWYEDSY